MSGIQYIESKATLCFSLVSFHRKSSTAFQSHIENPVVQEEGNKASKKTYLSPYAGNIFLIKLKVCVKKYVSLVQSCWAKAS